MFSRPPVEQPLAVCCSLPGVFVGHKFILDLIKEKLNNLPSSDLYVPGVVSIRFEDRNVILGTQKMTNRWVITVNCAAARDELLRVGLYMLNKRVMLKRYDEVLQEEYKEFKKCIAEQKKLYAHLGQAVCAEETP
ncbi:hypothetical protein CAPTEDRAFT_146765 [Capitella teleta]|uniref:Uncharacterized protein n=1 Tax=Capitella teleta TaxID=283909 RepID=R7TKU1_CAPTE|nr:hypothetical protein CAPTEDRAFT_146765 [Capitella teleta]|eukprot:ELT94428.1 hypothetical protein CAPTEDRAFT_146765 [Capitella teleta]